METGCPRRKQGWRIGAAPGEIVWGLEKPKGLRECLWPCCGGKCNAVFEGTNWRNMDMDSSSSSTGQQWYVCGQVILVSNTQLLYVWSGASKINPFIKAVIKWKQDHATVGYYQCWVRQEKLLSQILFNVKMLLLIVYIYIFVLIEIYEALCFLYISGMYHWVSILLF